jgi:adenine-specific DNA-methyltransferase
MTNHKTKLELTWIGKESRPRLEPRILVENWAKRLGSNLHLAHGFCPETLTGG